MDSVDHHSIRITNTRDPFDRLHAAWTDKFRLNSSFHNANNVNNTRFIYEAVTAAEEPNQATFTIPEGYSNSFEAFVKYVLQSTTMTLNFHWRPFFWACRPCHLNYEYITRLLKMEVIFNELNSDWKISKPMLNLYLTS